MATTLVDDVDGLFRSLPFSDAAAELDETESSVRRGFQTASAAILGALVGRSGESGFMRQAFDYIKNSFTESRLIDNVGQFFSSRGENTPQQETGGKFLSWLFAGRQADITEKVSRASGIRLDSASRLMSFAAPAVLGLLGRRVREDHLDAAHLSSLLQKDRSAIASMLPSGLNTLVSEAAHVAGSVVSPRTAPRSGRWVWLLAGLAALIALFWIATRGPRRTADQVRATASNVSSMVRTKLATGLELNIPSTGLEMNLITALKTGAADLNRWFEFDRLTFDTNSATLRRESSQQLNNIAAILTAYPNAKIKIGGYTDNVGDPQENLTLSQHRAESVRHQLIGMGIAPGRIEAEGYGEKFPVADNSTEPGRARNRRISLRLTQY